MKLHYEQTLATYRQLTGIRFKLLAFVPAISGAAIAVLGQANPDRWAKSGFAVPGFFVTLGIVLYDHRNTQFYDGAIGRAKHLEQELGYMRFENDANVGLFGSARTIPGSTSSGFQSATVLGLLSSTAQSWGLGRLLPSKVAGPRRRLWLQGWG